VDTKEDSEVSGLEEHGLKGAAWESAWGSGRMKIQGVSCSLLVEGLKSSRRMVERIRKGEEVVEEISN